MSPEEAIDNERLKVPLLLRYNFTERGYEGNFEKLNRKDTKVLVNSYSG